jgi:hypothetical protein
MPHSSRINQAFAKLATEASVLLGNSRRFDYVQSFFIAWMDRLSAEVRKNMSYEGALSRNGGAPDHDPGNWVYSKALNLLFPWMSSKWNDETVGDILEGVLGYARLAGRLDHWLPAWINRYVLAVEAFLQEVPYHQRSQLRSLSDCQVFVVSSATVSSAAMPEPARSSNDGPFWTPSTSA